MMIRIHGLILRSTNRVRLQQFYAALGVRVTEHQHGGPVHAECQDVDEEFVVEIYGASATYPRDALMMRVDSLEDSITAALAAEGQLLIPVKQQAKMRFAYITDPDGRPIMLLQLDS